MTILETSENYEPGQSCPGFLVGAESANERSEYRLVKATKSPTPLPRPIPIPIGPPKGFNADQWANASAAAENYEPSPQDRAPEGTPGAYAVIQYREWADEYRIRSRIEGTVGSPPPTQSGERVSTDLTGRAVRKIAESCHYVAKCQGGYKTFLTLTFNNLQRSRLNLDHVGGPFSMLGNQDVSWLAGPNYSHQCHTDNAKRVSTTIQREVSRFTDAAQKLWSRGWKAQFNVHGRRYHCAESNGDVMGQPGQASPLLYLWVVEVPPVVDPDTGEILGDNPHVHMLLNWRVPFRMFPSWAKRIESLWGQGFAHLERIKESNAAGAYMMKAAGYMSKAAGVADQGQVRGNRYGMSAEARAPGWVTLEEKQLHIMGALIADVNQHLTEKYEEQYQERRMLKIKLDNVPKEKKSWRRSIGKRLEKVRRDLEQRCPVVASKYQLIIKGKEAFTEFMHWAWSPGHWQAPIEWLPEKGPGEAWRPGTRPDTQWYNQFKKRHYWRRACRAAARLAWTDWDWAQARDDYEIWAEVEEENSIEGPQFEAY